MPARFRNCVFTLNNPTDEEIDHVCDVDPRVKYIVIGRETGASGTPHLQGYLELNNKVSLSGVKDIVGQRAHIEARRGSPKEAAGYCKKGTDTSSDFAEFFPRTEDDPGTWDYVLEAGEITAQGKRTDLTPAVEMIMQGERLDTVFREHPEIFVRYGRGLTNARMFMLGPRKLAADPEVIVLWGATGTGKTRDAYHRFWPDEKAFVYRPNNGNWWDKYDGEMKIILDEFRGSMPWADILGLLQRYEYCVQYKGGFVQIQADKFVITSPLPPDQWYRMDDRYDKLNQLTRRITQVHHYTELCPLVLPGTSGQPPLGTHQIETADHE